MSGGLEGQVVLVTGATSGIGLEAAKELARRGARLLLVARDRDRGEAARRLVAAASPSSGVDLLLADLVSLDEVRRLAREVAAATDRLDVLVHNAGLTSAGVRLGPDGVETTLAVNHLAPFLLTALLGDLLRASAPARVVTVASAAHRGARLEVERLERGEWTGGWRAYCESKLANILFTRELARRLEGSGVVANCLHPGVVRTGLGRGGPLPIRLFFTLGAPFLISPRKGAETLLHLAAGKEGGRVSGGYFERCRQRTPSAEAQDDHAARRLWELSERLTGLA